MAEIRINPFGSPITPESDEERRRRLDEIAMPYADRAATGIGEGVDTGLGLTPAPEGDEPTEPEQRDPRKTALRRMQRGGLDVPDDAGQRWRETVDARAGEQPESPERQVSPELAAAHERQDPKAPQTMEEAQALGKQQSSPIATAITSSLLLGAGRPGAAEGVQKAHRQKVSEPVREYMQRKQARAADRKGEMQEMELDQAKAQQRAAAMRADPEAPINQQWRDGLRELYPNLPIPDDLTIGNQPMNDLLQQAGDRRHEMLRDQLERQADLEMYGQKQQMKNEAMLDREKALHQMKLERAYAGSGTPGSGRVVDGEQGVAPYAGADIANSAAQGEVAIVRRRFEQAGILSDPAFKDQAEAVLQQMEEPGRIQTRSGADRMRDQVENLIGSYNERQEDRNKLHMRLASRAESYGSEMNKLESANAATENLRRVVQNTDDATLRQAMIVGEYMTGDLNPEAKKVRTAIDRYRSEIIKRIAGARVSPEELSRINSALGTQGRAHPDILRDVVEGTAEKIDRHRKRIRQGHRAGAWYAEQGGSIPPWMRDPQSPIRVRILGPDGDEKGTTAIRAGDWREAEDRVEQEYGEGAQLQEVQ